MKTLTGVLALILALMFGASSVVVAAGMEKIATPGASPSAAGQTDHCAKVKNNPKQYADCRKAAELGGGSARELPSCETCNRLCPGVCFMEGLDGCICFYDHLRHGRWWQEGAEK